MTIEKDGVAARSINRTELKRAFADAHRRTWDVLADLTPAQWQVPYHPGINPPWWEYSHVAWFTELWTQREPREDAHGVFRATRPALLPDADRWFDSARVPHRDRWHLDLPPPAALRDYVMAVHAGVQARLATTGDTDDDLYFFRLALFHEDMHGEALLYMRQTLDYAAPAALPAPNLPTVPTSHAAVEVGGETCPIGSPRGDGFVFDNEKWQHDVPIAPVRIDRHCVSNGAFAEFVAAGGYRDARWWSPPGLAWLRRDGRVAPRHWRRKGNEWEYRWFGQWQPLPLERPVCHVNAFEAEAFCRWAGARLPGEAEWECAASRGLIDWGMAVWEWTADTFSPYAGFTPDPYREYSAPWFDTHRAVRGASFATVPRLRHPRYRNFYLPERDDIFVGFRVCRPAR